MRKILLALATTALVVPAPARADLIEPTLKQATAITTALNAAHTYWQSDVCRDQWRIRYDTTLKARGRDGEATGMTIYRDGTWKISACEFTIALGNTGCILEHKIVHEVGHFIHGPSMDLETLEHHGPLANAVLDAVPCSAGTRTIERQAEAEAEAKAKAKQKRVKARWLAKKERSKIAKSTGYWR